MKKNKVACLLAGAMIFGAVNAFQPASHYALIERVGDNLSSGSKIAFAAGWLSHICGDLTCHGMYVNPECGVYLEREDTRNLHRTLEKNAEPYVYSALGGYAQSTYTKENLSKKFSNIDDIPFEMVSSLSNTVTMRTGTVSGAGTDDDIFFVIENTSGQTKRWKLDKSSYNDFENGDRDDYYLYINDKRFTPNNIKKIKVEKERISNSLGEEWYLQSVDVCANGTKVFSKTVERWLKGNTSVSYDSNWSNVKNTSDPAL